MAELLVERLDRRCQFELDAESLGERTLASLSTVKATPFFSAVAMV
ncbi:MAG: hypothetical protein ACOYLQ_11875 [Hyphomicrobiaceae bacterium]